MWPIFQHALLMSCHISYSWVVEVCLGFLGFSELLTNWYQSPITVEAAFTAGVFWLFLSPLCFSVYAQTPSLLCSTWAHCLFSVPELPGFILECIHEIKITKSWGWWIKWMLRFCQWQNNCCNYFFNHFPSLSSLSKQPVTHQLYLVIHNCLLFQLY